MKLSRRSKSVSDKTFSRLMRVGVLTLVVGIVGFGTFYYLDQHVDEGPSMVDRQIAGAEVAVRKAPSNISARLALASAYRSDKRNDDALKQYDEILKVDVSNRTALLGRGGILMTKGDLKAAAVAYHTITGAAVEGEFAGADTQLAEAYYFLGSIAVTQGKTKDASIELASALRIDRTDSDSLYLMGVVQLKDGSPKLAIDYFKQALLFVPTGWCEPYSQLVVAYGKLARAPEKAYAAGMASFCLKNPGQAKTQLKTLITGPVKVDAMLGLGLIAETESNTPEAISWYKKVLTIDAANIGAKSALSRLGAEPTAGSTSTSTTQGPS